MSYGWEANVADMDADAGQDQDILTIEPNVGLPANLQHDQQVGSVMVYNTTDSSTCCIVSAALHV